MSLQNALRFIELAGNRPELRERIQMLGTTVETNHLVDLGASLGLPFTGEQLQQAFARDWSMRFRYFQGRRKPTGNGSVTDGKAS